MKYRFLSLLGVWGYLFRYLLSYNKWMNDKVNQLLLALGFVQDAGHIWQKPYGQNCSIVVDGNAETIDYESAGIEQGDKTTGNFSQPENFVVLECVNRLLEKGYAPADLTLEQRWKLGRTAKGGKADIVVRDREGKTLIIIECKTAGAEYKKEMARMENSGGQLFSYFQQDKNARYLCLYTSSLEDDGEIHYENAIVKTADRIEDEDAFKKGDETVRLYKNAHTVTEMYEVWKKTFNLYFHYNGIFETDALAYAIELKPLKIGNLRPLSEATAVFNRFSEILRHNNISDNANAFNRFLSLILCKIVDEEKPVGAILDFQVKESGENAEQIQDRLQKLYQSGMKTYLSEEIVYHDDDAVRAIIKKYPEQTPLEEIERMFKEIKYYTNNEFSFKEVHNKELFEQNARVLNEVIRMLQNFRFKYSKKEPILGDFYELMLNHGIKQSEGQFFTPLPIARFILRSIGLDEIMKRNIQQTNANFLPKILDYACGAGHFLTESIDAIQEFLSTLTIDDLPSEIAQRANKYKASTEWARGCIFGVEKDYRLARAAQIACFLNGDGEANIIFGDGLESHSRLDERKQQFDLVLSNPPYSIKAFKNYLNIKGDDYALHEHLTESASEIEALFVERAAKALAPGGMAGIILPVTILSNTGIYTKTREILLENFEICGITELGGRTFIATGTNTVVLFLRRRHDNYKKDRAYLARDYFDPTYRERRRQRKLAGYLDGKGLLTGYAKHRGLALGDYTSIVLGNANANAKKSGLWQSYRQPFDEKEAPKIRGEAQFAELSRAEQDKQLDARFYETMLVNEREKFRFYMLCMDGDGCVGQKTVVVQSGSATEQQKAFLGYEFSKAKGREGIKILSPGGMLYDENDDANLAKASAYIRKNFWKEPITGIDESLREHVKIVNLVDCLDFDAIDFQKKILLEQSSPQQVQSKWNLISLGADFIEVKKGTAITKADTREGDIPVIAGGVKPAYYHDKSNREGNVITVSASGKAGYVSYHKGPIFASDCITIQSKDEGKIITLYIFYCLKSAQSQLFQLARGQIQQHVYLHDIQTMKIPLPPLEVQQSIVNQLSKIDEDADTARDELASQQERTQEVISDLFNS